MDALWSVLCIAAELTGSKQESQMLVVVEAPNAVATSRLQHVCQLDLPHQNHVPLEDLVDSWTQICLIVHSHFEHAEQKCDKVELVASAVVDSFIMSK